jgi:hypothetical protein
MLMAAWWCANTPQAATFELILWCKGAAHFSHQRQLRSDVAALLSRSPRVARVALAQGARETPPSAPLLEKVTVKRVDLCVQGDSLPPLDPDAVAPPSPSDDRTPDPRAPVPQLRPPRLA